MASLSIPTRRVDEADDGRLGGLMRAVAEGCRTSFTELHQLTRQRLFKLTRRLTPRREEAEDLLQEVYIKAWRHRSQFDPSRGAVMAWLFSIARRSSMDLLRRKVRRPVEVTNRLDVDGDYDQFASQDSSPTERLEQAERSWHVQSCLSALSHEQRESVLLSFFEGLTHLEIAERLSCPLGTIKSRLRRALTALGPNLQAVRA